MKFWTAKTIKEYDRACRILRYPQSVVGENLKEFVKQTDVVMDIGAGCGALAAFLSTICSKVYAVEPDEDAYRYITERIKRDNLTNVEAVNLSWPDDSLPQCDVITAFYVYAAHDTAEKVRKVLSKAKRGGIIFCNRAIEPNSITVDIMNRIGAEIPKSAYSCNNGCRLMGMLTALGIDATCQPFSHDFAQPVDSIDEATEFIFRMLRIGENFKEPIHHIIGEYIVEVDGQKFVPYMRESCLIFFTKTEV